MRRIIVSAIAIVACLALQAQNIRVNHSGVPDGNVQVSEPASKASGRFGETVMRDGEECIRVYTAEQFLNALGSYRHVLVAKNTEINLSPLLNDQSLFRTRFMMWMPEVTGGIEGGRATVVSEEVFDGRQLTMVNMKQLVIEGEGNSRIVVEPRYAIYHPTENLGTMNFCEQPSASQPNFFFPNPYDQDLPSRGIGPDSVDRNGKGE